MARYSRNRAFYRLLRLVEFRGSRYYAVDLAAMNHPFLLNLFDIVGGYDG